MEIENKFKVGDIAQAKGLVNFKKFNGQIGRITKVTGENTVCWMPFEAKGHKFLTDVGVNGIQSYKLRKL